MGVAAGPVVGSILYAIFGGYQSMMFAMGVLLVIFSLLSKKIMGEDKPRAEGAKDYGEGLKNIKTRDLLTTKRCFFAMGTAMLILFFLAYREPILGLRLDEFNLNQIQICLVYGITPVVGTIITIIYPRIKHNIVRRVILIAGLFFCSFCNICMGPSKLFHFPDKVIFVILSQVITGFPCVPLLGAALPEMIDAVKPLYPDSEE